MSLDYDSTGNPDTPIPYTLTAKAHAFLDRTAQVVHTAGAAVIDGALYLEAAMAGAILDGAAEWACGRCRTGWFGPVPADGLCRDCRDHR
jgi:hypothetical protein